MLRINRPVPALATVAVCLLVLAGACSQPSEGTDDQAGSTPGGQDAAAQDYFLSLAECVRDKGVNVPDPTFADGEISLSVPEGVDPAAYNEALEQCQKEVPAPDDVSLPSQDDPGYQASQVVFAECLRQRGHDVADPAAGEQLSLPQDVPEEDINECSDKSLEAWATSTASEEGR